jgi:D-alanine-D-alanine ligase
MGGLSKERVVILHDQVPESAPPDQQDALVQVRAVAEVMQAKGWEVQALPVGMDLSHMQDALCAARPALVFNLVESLGGDGRLVHLVPAVLESMAIPFTGCSMDAMFISSGKLLAKRWLAAEGLDTPAWWAPGEKVSPYSGQWIVKSAWEHASVGLDAGSVVPAESVDGRIRQSRERYGGDWFAERYIPGREFNLSLIGRGGEPQVLPVAEIRFQGFGDERPHIVDYAAKWHEESFEYQNTLRDFPSQPRDAPLLEKLRALARRCWTLFRLEGYARVDFRVDPYGRPWILEVNANPCLSPDAGFAAAAAKAGMGMEQVIGQIADEALARNKRLVSGRRLQLARAQGA